MTQYQELLNSKPPWERLSIRQRQVAELIALGLDRQAIARKMGVSDKTIDTLRSQAMDRLGTETSVELCRSAIAYGIIGVPTVETWRMP